MEQKERNQIRGMFDAVAFRYDCINRLVSLRRDTAWRKALAAALPDGDGLCALDLATGTGDVALALLRAERRGTQVVGADVSSEMLLRAQRKLHAAGYSAVSAFMQTDAAALCCKSNAFDLVTVAFGVRNFAALEQGLREIRRVLRPGGRALILEFSLPPNRMIHAAYLLYFRHILPRVAGWISRQTEAYRYLNRSVEAFPCGAAFCALLEDAGLVAVEAHPLTFGIATLYIAHKPA